jgi:glycogen synthase
LVWVSRITHQKMVDTVLEVLPALFDRDIQLAVIGQGEADAERMRGPRDCEPRENGGAYRL